MIICPECKNEKACRFCENTGEVSETLNQLHDLGFRNSLNSHGEYRIYLQKALNKLETISVDIVKTTDNLLIAKIECSGPTNFVKGENLETVDQVIKFLYQNH